MELNKTVKTDSFDEFKRNVIGNTYNYNITGSMQLCDYHKYYNSKYEKISRKLFSDIYKCITDNIIQHLQLYNRFKLPCNMGELILKYVEYKSEFKDGKLKTNRPIDWHKTLKLWHEDDECHKNKVLVRSDKDGVRVVQYNKHLAKYKHRYVFKILFTRNIKKQFNTDYYER